jgi:FkbM family methyltransferase
LKRLLGITRLVGRQQWLSPGLRRRLADLVLPPRAEEFETTAFGCRYRGVLNNYIDREVYFMGAYEPAVLKVLASLGAQRTGAVLLDVGANVGHHALFAAGRYAEVHAFEPYPPLVKILRDQVERNALRNVHVHATGLGDFDGEAEYAAPADDRAGYGGFDNPDLQLKRIRLPICRGDGFLRDHTISRVDVVKIDVEGSERRVMDGLASTLAIQRPALLVEYWPSAWPTPIVGCLPSDYAAWSVREMRTRGLVFNSRGPVLAPLDQASDGSMVLALPVEWPVPTGLMGRGE